MSEQVNLQEALVKKAAFGNDIDLEKFDDNNEQHVQSTSELSAAGKERLEHVGIGESQRQLYSGRQCAY